MLVDVLPKNSEGQIILDPAGRMGEVNYPGTVDPDWFKAGFAVASANTPLNDADLATLKGIDEFWSANADKWRTAGII